MDFLQRHLPRVYQAVQNALDYLSTAAAQIFGAPANAPRPSNSGSKVAIDTKTPQDPDVSKHPSSVSWGAGSDWTQGSGELTLEDALEATEWSIGHAEPPSATRDDTCRHSPGVTTPRTEERDLRHREGRTRRDLEYQTRDNAKEMPSETHFQTREPGHHESPAQRRQDDGDLEPEPTGDTEILMDETEHLEGRSHMCIQKISAQMEQMMVEDIGLLKDLAEDIESSGRAGDDGVTGDREAAETEDAEVLLEKMEKNEEQADGCEDETGNIMKLTDTGDTEAPLDHEEPADRCKDGMGFDLEVSCAAATVNLSDTTHWYTEEGLEGDLEQVDTRCGENPMHHSNGAGDSASDHHEGTMDKGDHDHPSSEVTEILLDHLEDLEISTGTLRGVNDVDQTKQEGLVDNSTPQIQHGEESPVFNVHLESKEGEETLFSENYPPSPCDEKTLNLDFMTEGKGEMGPSDQENKIKDVAECIEESVTEKQEDVLTSEDLENKFYIESNIQCFASDSSQSPDKSQETHQDSGKVDLESSQEGSADDLIPPEGQEDDWAVICVSGEEHVPLMDERENDGLCHLEEQKNQSETDTCLILDLGEILERFDVNTKLDSFSETLERSFVEEIDPIEQVEEAESIRNVDVQVSTSMEAESVVPGVTSTSLSFLEDPDESESVLFSKENLPLSQLHQPHRTTSLESEGNAGQGDEGVLLVLHLEEPEYSFLESDQTPYMIEEVQHEDRKEIYSSVNVPLGEEQLDEQAENRLRDFERTVWYEQYEESKEEEIFHSLVETNLQYQGGDFHELEGGEKNSDSNVRPEEELSSNSTNSDEILIGDTSNGLEATCLQNSGNAGNDQTNDRIEIKDIQEVRLENLLEDSSLSGAQYSPLEGSQTRASEKDTDFFTQIRSEISEYIEDEQSQQWTGESRSVSEGEVKGPIELSQTQEDEQSEVNLIQEEVVDTLLDEPMAFGLSEKSDLNLSMEMASVIDPDLNMEGMCDTHNELDLLSEIQNFIAPWHPEPTSSKFAEFDPEREIQSKTETGQLELEIEQVNEIHISKDILSPDHSSEDIPKEDVQSPHHSRKDIESSDHPTEYIESTEYSTEDIRPLAHPTEDIGLPDHLVEYFEPPDHSTKDIESPDHTTDDIQSPDHTTDDTESPDHPTEDIESTKHSTEDTESPYHPTEDIVSLDHPTADIRPPDHPAEYMVSTEHSAEDTGSSDYLTEDFGSLDLPTEDIGPLAYTTDDIKSPDHPVEDVESSDHSTEDTGSPDHPTEDVVSLDHPTEDIRPLDHPAVDIELTEHSAEDIVSLDDPTEDIRPPDHPTEYIVSAEHSADNTGSSDHLTEDIGSLDLPIEDIGLLDYTTDDIKSQGHPVDYIKSSDHSTEDIRPPDHPAEDIEATEYSTEVIEPPDHLVEDFEPPDHSTKDIESPDHTTDDIKSSDHPTDDIQSPDHPTEDIESTENSTGDIGSPDHPTETIGSPDHPTEDIRPPDHPTEYVESTEYSAEDIGSPDHPTEDIRPPDHPAKNIALPTHPAEDIESPEHSTEDNGTPDHPTADIVPPDHPTLHIELPAYPTEDIESSDHPTEDTESPKHSREDIRSTDHRTEDIGLQNQPREDIAITMLTESNIAASADDNESLSDSSGLHGNISAVPEIDIVISVDSSGAELSESQTEPESSHALDVIREGNEQENKEKASREEQIICQIPNKSADKRRGTWEKEDKLQSTNLPSDGDSSKNMKDHKEHHLRPSEDHLQKDPTQPEGEDEADADWEAHRTLDLSAQKSRVLLRRKTSIRRKQGQRQSLPEPQPAEQPVPVTRRFPVALPGLGVKLPIPHPPAHATPSEPPPPEQRNEPGSAHEELTIKPKKVIPKHAGFGMPHPQMMQELQSRLLKKKPKE